MKYSKNIFQVKLTIYFFNCNTLTHIVVHCNILHAYHSFFYIFYIFRAWIIRIVDQKEKNQAELETSSDDEDEPVVVSKKRKQEKAKKPSVKNDVNNNKKKKNNNKNDGLLQESQFMESETDSD